MDVGLRRPDRLRLVSLLDAPTWRLVMDKRYRRDRLFVRWANKHPWRAFAIYVALAVLALLLGVVGNYVHDEQQVVRPMV